MVYPRDAIAANSLELECPRALEVAWPPTSGRARVRSTESIFRLTEGRHHMVLGDLLNQLHVPSGQPAVRGLAFRTG
jgi:hypothetical protein